MDLTSDITALGIATLMLASGLFVVTLSLFSERAPTVSGWLVTGAAAFLGAFVASEYLGLDAFGRIAEGVAWMPALIVGGIVGVAVEAIRRRRHGGPTTHGAPV